MAWTDLTFDFGSILTSSKMTNLQANFQAMADGDSGAPIISQASLAPGIMHGNDNGSYTQPTGAETTKITLYFYNDGNCNYLDFRFGLKVSNAGYTAYCKVTANGVEDVQSTQSLASEEKTSQIDLSGLAVGWASITVKVYSNASGFTATMSGFAYYIS